MEGKTGDNLITVLESRLDSVVYRMGLALTRREARQLVSHGHYTVNGSKVNIPSYRVKVGDVIALKESDKTSEKFKATVEATADRLVPVWLVARRATYRRAVLQVIKSLERTLLEINIYCETGGFLCLKKSISRISILSS